MKAEDLLDAIGEVRDQHILDAHTVSRSNRPRWYAAIAAVLALLLCVGSMFGPAGAGPGGNGNLSYLVYAGPVLPLTACTGPEGLTAERNITLDFRDYERTDGDLQVADSYVLTNHTDQPKTISLLYPYTGTLLESDLCPQITVDGCAITAQLYPGDYAGGFEGPWGSAEPVAGSCNLDLPASFGDYQTLLLDGSYQNRAMVGYTMEDRTAFVYRLHDFTFPQEDNDAIYELRMDFEAHDQVFSDGFERSGSDPAAGRYFKTVTLRSKSRQHGDAYVIALGEDLVSYSLRGSRRSGADEPDVGCTVTRYETTWKEVLLHFLAEEGLYDPKQPEKADFTAGAQFPIPAGAMYSNLTDRLLRQWGPWGETPVERYADGRLGAILREAAYAKRVLYLSFEVTIPAEGDTTVAAAMVKEPSYDPTGHGESEDGYDFAASLGSTLTFTKQTATLKNAQFVQITAQNFCFDPAAGIITVPLTEEHHWIKVRN